jgi:hypothetical protein
VQTGRGLPCVCPFASTIGVVSLTIARWPLSGTQLRHRGPATYTTRWDATPQDGADRRSAKNADAPMDQSREAHLAERSLHSPEGSQSAAGCAADWPPSGAATRADTAMMEGRGTRPLRAGCPGSLALRGPRPARRGRELEPVGDGLGRLRPPAGRQSGARSGRRSLTAAPAAPPLQAGGVGGQWGCRGSQRFRECPPTGSQLGRSPAT